MLPAPPKAADELAKLQPFMQRIVGLTAYEDQHGLQYAESKVRAGVNTLLRTAVGGLQQQQVSEGQLKQILQDRGVAEFMQYTRVLLLRGQLRKVEQKELLQQHRASVLQRRIGGGMHECTWLLQCASMCSDHVRKLQGHLVLLLLLWGLEALCSAGCAGHPVSMNGPGDCLGAGCWL
jgi:hypothetical protein